MQDHLTKFQLIHKDRRSLQDLTLRGVRYSLFQTRSLLFAQLELELFWLSQTLRLGKLLIGFSQLGFIQLLFSFLLSFQALAQNCLSKINLISFGLLDQRFAAFLLNLVFKIRHHSLRQMLNPFELIH